jgi:hypothetical protein
VHYMHGVQPLIRYSQAYQALISLRTIRTASNVNIQLPTTAHKYLKYLYTVSVYDLLDLYQMVSDLGAKPPCLYRYMWLRRPPIQVVAKTKAKKINN